MIVTETEAKTKRCQESFSTTVLESDTHLDSFGPAFCIGAACMAWRWDGVTFVEGQWVVKSPARGYCGKAGKP